MRNRSAGFGHTLIMRFLRLLSSHSLWLATLVMCIWVLGFTTSRAITGAEGLGWSPGLAMTVAFLSGLGGAWLGWAVRQAWIYPPRLRRAEALWSAGGYASDVVDQLAKIHWAVGEVGYRTWLLRSKANLALGFRDLAWAESEEAHLSQVPFWLRPFFRGYLRSLGRRSRRSLDRSSRFWLGCLPDNPSLKWGLAIHYLRLQGTDARERAWELLLSALPYAGEDTILLEDLMLALLGRIEEHEPAGGELGRQERDPEIRAAFERVLDVLLHHHGGPRTGWDRVPPAVHLLRVGRYDEALSVCRTLPPDRRPEPIWAAMLAAYKGLGDLDAAWRASTQALAHQPESFRLWMMREDVALETHQNAEALDALAKSAHLFKDGGPVDALREWHTRRAEFAYWIEEDTEEAAKHLDFLPTGQDREGRAPLRLLVLLDLERYEDVHHEVTPLLAERPDDPELQLVQAESLAGMGAWESLQEQLETASEATRQRSAFWHLRGLCRCHLDDLLGAREDLERSAQMEPDNVRYVLDAGHACADLGEWERSEYHWRQVLRRDERNEEALTQLAEARRTLHDAEGAKRLLRECLLHHPDCTSAQGMLAELEAN